MLIFYPFNTYIKWALLEGDEIGPQVGFAVFNAEFSPDVFPVMTDGLS